jgi:hypothetical protein
LCLRNQECKTFIFRSFSEFSTGICFRALTPPTFNHISRSSSKNALRSRMVTRQSPRRSPTSSKLHLRYKRFVAHGALQSSLRKSTSQWMASSFSYHIEHAEDDGTPLHTILSRLVSTPLSQSGQKICTSTSCKSQSSSDADIPLHHYQPLHTHIESEHPNQLALKSECLALQHHALPRRY